MPQTQTWCTPPSRGLRLVRTSPQQTGNWTGPDEHESYNAELMLKLPNFLHLPITQFNYSKHSHNEKQCPLFTKGGMPCLTVLLLPASSPGGQLSCAGCI